MRSLVVTVWWLIPQDKVKAHFSTGNATELFTSQRYGDNPLCVGSLRIVGYWGKMCKFSYILHYLSILLPLPGLSHLFRLFRPIYPRSTPQTQRSVSHTLLSPWSGFRACMDSRARSLVLIATQSWERSIGRENNARVEHGSRLRSRCTRARSTVRGVPKTKQKNTWNVLLHSRHL